MVDQVTPNAPVNYWNVNEWNRILANIINQILDGKLNAVGEVTLGVSVTTTTLSDRRIGTNSRVHLVAETSTAAAVTGLFINGYTAGQCTINHDSNAATDRTFRYSVIG